MRDIIDVQGRKMSFACPIVACGECSIPSPHTSPRSRGRLAWVEDVVLACPPCSKQPGGQQPQKAAIRLPRFLWGYLTGFAYTEEQRKDVFFKKEKKKRFCGYVDSYVIHNCWLWITLASPCPAGSGLCSSAPHSVLAVALPFAKELFSTKHHPSRLQKLQWEGNACNGCIQTPPRAVRVGQGRDPSSQGSCLRESWRKGAARTLRGHLIHAASPRRAQPVPVVHLTGL